MAAGGMPVLPKRGAARTPPLRSRHVSEIGPPNRPARHPKRLIRPTRDTNFGGLEGEWRAGSFLGLARAGSDFPPARRQPEAEHVNQALGVYLGGLSRSFTNQFCPRASPYPTTM